MVASPLVPAPPPAQLILASASPRRRELLAQLAIPFTVLPAHIDESVMPGEVPWAYTRRVAYAKAQHVARQCPTAVVLGADSVVVLEHSHPRQTQRSRRRAADALPSQWSGAHGDDGCGRAPLRTARGVPRCGADSGALPPPLALSHRALYCHRRTNGQSRSLCHPGRCRCLRGVLDRLLHQCRRPTAPADSGILASDGSTCAYFAGA